MPVKVARLADFSTSLKAQPSDMPQGGWCKPPARPVVMTPLADRLHQSHTPDHAKCRQRHQRIDGNSVEHGSESRLLKVRDACVKTDRRQRGDH